MGMLLKNKWFLLAYGAGAVVFIWLFFELYRIAPALAIVFALAVGLLVILALGILTEE